jgi:flagellar motor protein MotB
MRLMIVAAGAVGCLVAFTGCASKTKEQLATVRAENVDLRQRAQDSEEAYARTQAEADAAALRVAKSEEELTRVKNDFSGLAQASAADRTRLASIEQELAAERKRLDDAQKKLSDISSPKHDQPGYRISNPSLEAFRRDLQAQLSRFHVTGVDVDVRTAQDGQQRVALVLQNSFRAGSASLSYNTSATKAVVGLGKLISESYPGSRVVVEGHTDADPIVKSKGKWDSNDSLSLARAEEVKKMLRQSGTSDRMVSAVGMGSRQLVARGTTDRAKAQNRRVEIYIYPTAN